MWNSEEVVVPYKCKTDNKLHRYFVDLLIQMEDKKTYLIEIKPKNQTTPPKTRTRKTKKYINEVTTYAKNISKWEAAQEFAEHKGWKFQVWTEETLKNLGIKIL
jgi:short-subunit dehydrogenase involved in D-alanine esterification of teichoic acids